MAVAVIKGDSIKISYHSPGVRKENHLGRTCSFLMKYGLQVHMMPQQLK